MSADHRPTQTPVVSPLRLRALLGAAGLVSPPRPAALRDRTDAGSPRARDRSPLPPGLRLIGS